MLSPGICTIAADQAGNHSYNPAPQITQNISFKLNQTITFGSQADQNFSPNGTFGLNPLATASSDLAVSYSSLTPSVCTISNTTVTMLSAGTCTIAANQAGDDTYNPAPQVSRNITINKANQTITFGTQPAQTFSPGGMFTLNPEATASSGLTVSYSSTTLGVCTISDAAPPAVTMLSAGTCTIAANQAGDGNYNPAPQESQNIIINGSADVSVAKTDGVTSAVPGLSISYTIVASNAGPSDDPSVTVTDTFPGDLTCTWTSVAAGGATNSAGSGSGNLSETLSLPSGGSVTYTVNCTIASIATDTLSNTATVTGSFDPNNINNVATDNDTVLLGLDFGDAPDPLNATTGQYPTLLANDGARHAVTGPLLGSLRDAESDGQPSADATGDDLNNQADEDGVNFTETLIVCEATALTVVASAPALLDAWIDFNQDGVFASPTEQIFTNQAVMAGSNSLSATIPCDALSGNTYARFRLSTAGGLTPTGGSGRR